MRLDRFFSVTGTLSRSEASKFIRKGAVSIDGKIESDPAKHIDPEKQTVCLNGQKIIYSRYTYIMMNKPVGAVCATEDGGLTVIDLLPEKEKRMQLFPCGRLDKNTTGFVLITDNGTLAHRLLSPSSHCEKSYRFLLKFPYSNEDIATLENGVPLDEKVTKPCKIKRLSDYEGEITLHEGKFHQIKRMFEYVHNQVRELSRISFAEIPLDAELKFGEWRFLTDNEIAILESYDKH